MLEKLLFLNATCIMCRKIIRKYLSVNVNIFPHTATSPLPPPPAPHCVTTPQYMLYINDNQETRETERAG
jgi:hypothetical protein